MSGNKKITQLVLNGEIHAVQDADLTTRVNAAIGEDGQGGSINEEIDRTNEGLAKEITERTEAVSNLQTQLNKHKEAYNNFVTNDYGGFVSASIKWREDEAKAREEADDALLGGATKYTSLEAVETWIDSLETRSVKTNQDDGFRLIDKEDRKSLNKLNEVLFVDDESDKIVNKLEEVLKVFEKFDETVNLADKLTGMQEQVTQNSGDISNHKKELNGIRTELGDAPETVYSSIYNRIKTLEDHKAVLESTEVVYGGTLEEFLDDFANIKLTNGNYISQNDLNTNFLRNNGDHAEFILSRHHLVPGKTHKIIFIDGSTMADFTMPEEASEGNYTIYFKPTGNSSESNVRINEGNGKVWVELIEGKSKTWGRTKPSQDFCLRGMINGTHHWGDNEIKLFYKEENPSSHQYMGQFFTWGDSFKVYAVGSGNWYGYDSLSGVDNKDWHPLAYRGDNGNIDIKKPGNYDIWFDSNTCQIGIDTSYFSPYYMDEVSSPFRATITADKAFVFDALSGISIYSFDEGANRTVWKLNPEEMDKALNEILNASKEYATEEDVKTLESAKDYSDTVLEAAKTYSDEKTAEAKTQATEEFSAAKAHATQEAGAALETAKLHSDGNLKTAKDYTDELNSKIYGSDEAVAVKKATADSEGNQINSTYAKISRLNTVCGKSLYSTSPNNIDDVDLYMNFISGLHVDENTLVLNQNFKTLNGQEIFGEGDIPYIYDIHIVSGVEEIDGELNYKFDYATINGQSVLEKTDIVINAETLGVYTKEEVDELIDSIDVVIPGEGGNVDLSEYAKLSDLDDYVKAADLKFATKDEISNLVDREEVEDLIGSIELPEVDVDLTNYVTKDEIKNFVTTSELSNYATTDQLFSGNYNDLTNKPTKLSDFTNDLVNESKVLYSGETTSSLTVSDISKGEVFLWYGKHNGVGAVTTVIITKNNFGSFVPAYFKDWACGIKLTKNSDTKVTMSAQYDYAGTSAVTTYKLIQLA